MVRTIPEYTRILTLLVAMTKLINTRTFSQRHSNLHFYNHTSHFRIHLPPVCRTQKRPTMATQRWQMMMSPMTGECIWSTPRLQRSITVNDRSGTNEYSAPAAQVGNSVQALFTKPVLMKADENMKMTDCYYDTKDWRACKKEVRRIASPF